MFEKPLACKNCRHWYGGVPRTKYASWCTVHSKPALRALNACIENKSKEIEEQQEWIQIENC